MTTDKSSNLGMTTDLRCLIKDTDGVDVYLLNNLMYCVCAHKGVYLKFTEEGIHLGNTTLDEMIVEVSNKAINPCPLEMSWEEFKILFIKVGNF